MSDVKKIVAGVRAKLVQVLTAEVISCIELGLMTNPATYEDLYVELYKRSQHGMLTYPEYANLPENKVVSLLIEARKACEASGTVPNRVDLLKLSYEIYERHLIQSIPTDPVFTSSKEDTVYRLNG